MPTLKINNKQINGEIVKLIKIKVIKEKKLQNKKKIKEWFKLIFFILLFISLIK
tara:strand:- start:271 stop:432 length:162 start_codon:yes stop_codon:yes gene_type:complete